MKIGILTQPLGCNYGGNIQNWALQQILKRMGHHPVTINLFCGSKQNLRQQLLAIIDFSLAIYARYIKRDWSRYVNNPLRPTYRNYEPSRLDYDFRHSIAKTKELTLDDDWKRKAKIKRFDAFIVGSDQVWRQEYSPRIETYFLDFLNVDDNRPRIAYAASFGSNTPINEDKIARCAELLHRFNAVSVRENSGLDILKRDFSYNDGVKVLDPTLLLKAEDYLSLVKPSDRKGTHIGCYILDETEEKDTILQSVTEVVDKKIKKISIRYKGFHQPTMSEWLAMFADSEYVVTDSFHGCVFSIIFHKPFVAMANKYRGLDRFVSLLEPLGLIDRLVYNIEDFTNRKESLLKSIDYTEVEKKLDQQRKESMVYLQDALSK